MLKSLLSSYSGFSFKTWIIVSATFVNAIGTAVAIFLALYLTKYLHYPIEHAAYIVSASGFGAIVGSSLGGFLCDRFEAYKISIIMLLASGLTTCCIVAFSQFEILFLLTFLAGAFFGAFKPANTINLLQGCAPSDRAKVNGLSRIAVNLGIGIASVIGGIFASISYQFIFLFDGISSCVAALILIYFSYLFKFKPNMDIEKPKHHIFSVLNDKITIALCFVFLINCIVFFQSWTTFPLYINDYFHLNTTQFGYLFLLNCLIIVFLEVPILNAVKNCNQILIAMIGSFLICFSMFILIINAYALIAVISFILLTIGEILLFSTMLILIIDRSSESSKGKYIGFYQAVFSAANMLAPLFGSYIYTRSPILLWYCCGLAGIVCAICFHFINMSLKANQFIQITEQS